jgi:hypothetical protein
MRNNCRRMLVRWGWLPIVTLLVLPPSAAAAQTAPAMHVERTPTYTVELTIGDAEQMLSPMEALTARTGEVMVSGGPMATPSMMGGGGSMATTPMMGGSGSMATTPMMGGPSGTMTSGMDQGMSANHHVEVHLMRNDTGAVVNDVTPTIRITDRATGASRDLPQVMGMYGVLTGMSDFHYAQNVWLPDGTYSIAVMVGSDVARFRDLMVMGGAPMSTGAMGPSGPMGASSPMSTAGALVARDGRQLSTEPATTQSLFMAVWGDRAALKWATEHNAALPQA